MAFQTENELKAHVNIMHSIGRTQTSAINATALLGFRVADDEDEDTHHRKKVVKKERQAL